MASIIGLWILAGLISVVMMWAYSLVFLDDNDEWIKYLPLVVAGGILSLSFIIVLWIGEMK